MPISSCNMGDLNEFNPTLCNYTWGRGLLDPKITPEKALHLLPSHCFSPDTYTRDHEEPRFILYSFLYFLMIRRPDACVDGIWGEILRKLARFWRYFNDLVLDGGSIFGCKVICPAQNI